MRFRYSYLLALSILIIASSCATRKTEHLVSKGHTNSTTKIPSSGTSTTSTSNSKGSTSSSGLAYIERYKDIAIREMNKYGIPASIKLAQALLESGNGNSTLAREANNHFGIKCGGVWKGKSMTKGDDSPNDCFRVYDNPEDSFRDHSEFLLRKRYEKLFSLDRNDYKGWAKGLKEAGYATNPRYPDLLISLIERYELYKYDLKESFVEKEQRETKVETIIDDKISSTSIAKQAEPAKSPVAMVIHEVKPSDTLYSLSRQYNVTVEKIKLWNGLNTDNLSIGQLLVVSK